MIKSTSIKFLGETTNGRKARPYLTTGKSYPIVAGQGDGSLARSDGKVGAFIKPANVFEIKCDDGHVRTFTYNPEFWSYSFAIIDSGINSEKKNPLDGRAMQMNPALAAKYGSALVEGGEISNGDYYHH